MAIDPINLRNYIDLLSQICVRHLFTYEVTHRYFEVINNKIRLVSPPSLLRWYFRKIKRIEAEKKLLLPENEHGAFLIRDSESRQNDYSLSGTAKR